MEVDVRAIRSRGRAFSIMLAIVAVAVSPTVAVGRSEITVEFAPPAPTGKALQEYLALPDHPPIFEDQGDFTTQVVVFNNWIKAAGDDEFRAAFPAGWDDKINAAIERADDEMYVQFGIDFRVASIVQWDTWPDGSRTCGTMIDELNDEIALGTNDTVAGYTAHTTWIDDPPNAGCSIAQHALIKRQNTNETAEKKNRWVVTQHEYGHLYNAPDRSGAAHPNDVMENPYSGYDFWCTTPGYNDWGLIYAARATYE